MKKQIPLVIPSYEPDVRLIELIKTLKDYKDDIIIVDDGSGEKYQSIFNELTNIRKDKPPKRKRREGEERKKTEQEGRRGMPVALGGDEGRDKLR